jgi:hypothetical protein
VGKEMTFGLNNYEKAIARIFDKDGNVIGTGFLVAPGYVLTCAHVVLQAMKVEEEAFKFTDAPFGQIIKLDFPMASDEPLQAEVVAWRPYRIDGDDIAGLKLLGKTPETSKPMPMVRCDCASIQDQRHAVYGFANDNGDCTKAYRPKSGAPSGRFQLCKGGDGPPDEEIEGGFSGAPVFNYDRPGIVGMVATASVTRDKRSKAYAISTYALWPVLKEIEAHCLHDVLMQSLEGCDRDEQKHQLKIAIDQTFSNCNPLGSDKSRLEQLKDLAGDRASVIGWEDESRLVHFAMMLAWMDGPVQVSEKIEAWVTQCGFIFSDLLVRIDREMKRKNILPSNNCQRLMAIVTPKESSSDQVRVSLLVVADRETYNPQSPQKLGLEETLPIAKLPEFIWRQIREKLPNAPTTIHLFVPRSLFDHGIEMMPRNQRGAILGNEYPFVLRTNPNTHPIEPWNRGTWEEKWKKIMEDLENKTVDVLKPIDCSQSDRLLVDDCRTAHAAILQECSSAEDLFDLIAEDTVLPVALWSREAQFQGQLPGILDCVVKVLHERVRQERDTAFRSPAEKLLGHNLSLVWEDPKIVPPDEQFNQEDC